MKLNKKQKKIILFGAILFILIGIFPPWSSIYKSNNLDSKHPVGYGLIFAPHQKVTSTYSLEIDARRLTVQWIIVLVATGVGVFLTSTVNKD